MLAGAVKGSNELTPCTTHEKIPSGQDGWAPSSRKMIEGWRGETA